MNEISSRAPFSAKELWTDEDEPRRLVLLSDEVRSHALPWKMASAELLNELAASPEFYIARPGRRARLVTDADVWCFGLPSGERFLAAIGFVCKAGRWTSGLTAAFDVSVNQALVERFFKHHNPGSHLALTNEQIAALPAVANWSGARGLLAWLRLQWLLKGRDISCLGEHEGGYVAVLPRTTDMPSSAPRSEPKALKAPGARWTAEVEDGLLKQFLELRKSIPKVESADIELGEVWGVSPSAIKQARLRAQQSASARTAPAGKRHRIAD